MPIYEYQCQDCHHNFDKLQKMSDDPLTECPECHHNSLQKQVSAPSFKLKGSGWYETDFKTKKKEGATQEAKPEATQEKPSTSNNKSD